MGASFGTSTRSPRLDAGGDTDTPGAKYHTARAHGKQAQSTKRSQPAWSFGNGRDGRDSSGGNDPSPGPGQYETAGLSFSSTGASFSGRASPDDRSGRQSFESTQRTSPSAKFGTSVRPPLLETGGDTPGPIYAWTVAVGPQPLSTRRSQGGCTLGAR
jgi:hypothetical protein